MDGYSRKHRKTRRTKRGTRRKGYGGTESQHAGWGDRDLSDAISSAATGAELAQHDRCDSANNLLIQARGFYAAAVAHSKSGGRVQGLTMGSETLASATRLFKSHCKVVRR